MNNIIVGHLNEDSLSDKVDQLKLLIMNIVDVTKTKLDETFPSPRFLIDEFLRSFRVNTTQKRSDILIVVKNDITCKLSTKHNFSHNIKRLFIELSFRKSKCLFLGTYHPPSQNDQYYFD